MLTIHEAIIVLNNIPKDQLAASIKRTSNAIFQRSGFFRDIQYMGFHRSPYRLSKNKTPHWDVHYVFYEFNLPQMKLKEVRDEWDRDRDVVRHTIFHRRESELMNFEECTFEDEMKPVPYRPEVIKLVHLARGYHKNKDKRLKLNMSTPFYPFQR